jgi:hypothetical protein
MRTSKNVPRASNLAVTYLLDNLAPETGGRFAGLEACFDETTLS